MKYNSFKRSRKIRLVSFDYKVLGDCTVFRSSAEVKDYNFQYIGRFAGHLYGLMWLPIHI